jgi:hypothetical protein
MSKWQAHPYNKKFFAIALLPVAVSKHCFIFVDVGSYGKCSDSSIFKTSELRKRIHENALTNPPAKLLDSIFHPSLLYLFVGEEAFGLSMKLLRPYGRKNRLKKNSITAYVEQGDLSSAHSHTNQYGANFTHASKCVH